MKYFTPDWCHGCYDDDRSDEIVRSYWDHLSRIAGQIPTSLLKFAREISVHDAIPLWADLSVVYRQLVLCLCCGDKQTGYADLTVEYRGVSVDPPLYESLDMILREPSTTVLHDEVDLGTLGQYEHRILCDPAGELCVTFSEFRYDVVRVPDRHRNSTWPRLRILGKP